MLIVEKRAICNECGWASEWDEHVQGFFAQLEEHIHHYDQGQPCLYAIFNVQERIRSGG